MARPGGTLEVLPQTLSGDSTTKATGSRSYCTTSVKPVVFTIDPLVAVTTTVETPVGVPASGGGLWLGLLLVPAPHPGATSGNSSVSKKNPEARSRFPLPTRLDTSLLKATIRTARL